MLGNHHPAALARTANFWDSRCLVPIQKAKELLGSEFFEVNRQYGWVGDGGFFMHDVLDDGETVQFVLSGLMGDREEWEEDQWSQELDRAKLEKILESWSETPEWLKKAIVEIMLQNQDLKAFAQQHHAIDAPTYAKGRVAIMGDAAHCMTPWQGSGAGQAIEDAMILEALLGNVTAPNQIDIAFQVYDQLRRPRAQRIVHSSAETGLIMCGRGAGAGLDIDKIREILPSRWAFIYGKDQADHKKEALTAFEKLRQH